MRHLLDSYDYQDFRLMFSDEEIVSLMVKDIYYVKVISDLIVNDIHEHEIEGFEDIYDMNIRVRKFRDEQGDDVVLELLEKNGYTHDMCCLISDEYYDEITRN